MAKKDLKEKAWKMFALYIKLRDANVEGVCSCCTCGKRLAFDQKDCQAGHFVAGRSNAVLFNSKVVHAQCATCNIFNSGEQGKYVLFMKKRYGYSDEDIEKMLQEKKATLKLSDEDVKDMILTFFSLILVLLDSKYSKTEGIKERVENKIASFKMKGLLCRS